MRDPRMPIAVAGVLFALTLSCAAPSGHAVGQHTPAQTDVSSASREQMTVLLSRLADPRWRPVGVAPHVATADAQIVGLAISDLSSSGESHLESADATEVAFAAWYAWRQENQGDALVQSQLVTYALAGFGVLEIHSEPPDAEIWLDERQLALRTDATVGASAGKRRVRLRKEGFLDAIESVVVAPRGRVVFKRTLIAQSSR